MPTEPGLAVPDQPVPMASEPRQRWRLTFARVEAADGETPSGRDYITLWEAALAESKLPVATTDAGRCRFAIGAPLPARTAGRAELADLLLTERVPAWRVREAIERVLPPGHELAAVEDIWLGAPALAGRVAAADYRVMLRGPVDGRAITAAADRLLAADRLVRERAKGSGVKSYDLRPLLISLDVGATAGDGSVDVRIRTRIHPELGSGRPEEVVAAIAEQLGEPLEPIRTIRERLVLVDDLDR
jgi:radical SAM-linked protein